MPRSSHLQRRQSGYSYRRRVPKAIQAPLGKHEIVVSLKTHCPRTAEQRKAPLEIAVNQLFAEAGYMTDQLTHLDAEAIAEQWRRKHLNQDFEQRIRTASDVVAPSACEISQRLESAVNSLNTIDITPMTSTLKDVAKSHDIILEPSSPDWQRLGYAMLKANVTLLQEMQKRADPNVFHPMSYLELSTPTPSAKKRRTISQAYKEWDQDSDRRPYTRMEWSLWVKRFIECTGDLYVDQLTKQHMSDFKKQCRLFPRNLTKPQKQLTFKEVIKRHEHSSYPKMSSRSINKGLTSISGLLNWCINEGYCNDNPAARMRIAISDTKKATSRRQPFSPEELRTIFEESPVFAEGERPQGGAAEAAYWIPILGLYTGARLEEIGTRQVTDIRQHNGIWYIDINADAPGMSVKTASSIRRVPIHRRVLELGFLEYRDRIAQSHKDLFPQVHAKARARTTSYSKWFNRYLRNACGIEDTRKVFHSFRHTFKDACREAGIQQDVHDALTGHTDGSVSKTYGSGHSLNTLNEAIQKINYLDLAIPSLNLPARATTLDNGAHVCHKAA